VHRFGYSAARGEPRTRRTARRAESYLRTSAAFNAPEELRVIHVMEEVGRIGTPPAVGEFLILAGRRCSRERDFRSPTGTLASMSRRSSPMSLALYVRSRRLPTSRCSPNTRKRVKRLEMQRRILRNGERSSLQGSVGVPL
jgi:hypothetical protein